jgi:cytochrome c-type biogenesis protein CcmH/NrfF
LVLWIAAPVVLMIGGMAVFLGARRRRKFGTPEPIAELSEEEQAALRDLDGR